uniref:Uncharacterized protein n=1 Tax=Setaria viridis TaxID=4556 RepID=A0A4U6WG62_SETVI|nr:LOW QUALITY PROTEIN: hypothetical protein SEVIR_1G287300v2 [Setaria viridis]
MCTQAFYSRCCYWHHDILVPTPSSVSVWRPPGRPTFPKHYPNGQPIEDDIVKHIVAHDFATSADRDAYCVNCVCAFSTGICNHHHQRCGRDSIVRRIEEHDGRHYTSAARATRSGDPVGEDCGELMLQPLLRRKKGTCVQCGGPVPHPLWSRCSPTCAADHDREVAQRRKGRDARRTARQMDKLLLFRKKDDQATHR